MAPYKSFIEWCEAMGSGEDEESCSEEFKATLKVLSEALTSMERAFERFMLTGVEHVDSIVKTVYFAFRIPVTFVLIFVQLARFYGCYMRVLWHAVTLFTRP